MRTPPKPNICISFSGGRTSALMTHLIKQAFGHSHRIIVTFANTGVEDPRTLNFIRECDEHLGFNTVWLEAVFHRELGKGTTHAVVNYETACRDERLFEAGINKFGIPNKAFPWCTRELKQRALEDYIHTLGLTDYCTAIGIRADESDRMSSSADKNGWWYPLVSWGITKEHVLSFWKAAPFDLYIPEHHGNCRRCWKKSDRKIFTLMRENPEEFAWCARMERENGYAGAGEGLRTFWRKKRDTFQMLAESTKPFQLFTDPNFVPDPELDAGSACGETCEVGADE